MTEELWKPVAGYEGLYDVSTLGRVRSHPRIVDRKHGTARWPGKVLAPQKGSKGHYAVAMWRDKKQQTKFIHRLVAEAFLPNPDNLPVVRHLNDIKEDNTLENLAWGTYADNAQDAIRNGRIPKREPQTHCLRGHLLSGLNLYINPKGSRACVTCRDDHQKNNALRNRRERTSRGLPPEDPRHGTLNGYSNYGCKCEGCKAAGKAYVRKRRRDGVTKTESGK